MPRFTAATVARDLRAHGIVVVKFTESPDPGVEDDEVTLSDRLHIQVCSMTGSRVNYVLETRPGIFKFGKERTSFAGLLADLQKLAKQTPAAIAIEQMGITDCRCPACNLPVTGKQDVIDNGPKPANVTSCQHCNTAVRCVDSPAGELSQWYFEAGVLAS